VAETDETGHTATRAAPSRLPLVIGLVLAFSGGGAGFYAAWAGLLPFGAGPPGAEAGTPAAARSATAGDGTGRAAADTVDFGDLVYVPVEIVSCVLARLEFTDCRVWSATIALLLVRILDMVFSS